MPKQEKVERVAALKARIDASDAILLTDYRGLTVSDISACTTRPGCSATAACGG